MLKKQRDDQPPADSFAASSGSFQPPPQRHTCLRSTLRAIRDRAVRVAGRGRGQQVLEVLPRPATAAARPLDPSQVIGNS